MWKSLAAIITAALVAGAITGFPIEPVSATSTAGVKAIAAPTCPNRGWPYQQCNDATSVKVRLVTTDKLN
jgi:hypothetical protein